ncbi:hypothetical protein [Glaciihabitans sp. UYNi722]|uniref:hypothetical protein n=1 Tax=Glaciihabitans sp. UYNi722 TaxID=3156344 RepID=UPI003395B188
MNWWIFGGVVLGIIVLGLLLQHFKFIDLSGKDKPKSSGSGSGIMGIGDEVFAPSRHEAAIEMDRQTILPAPAPLAGDPSTGSGRVEESARAGLYKGQVKIDLSQAGKRST